MKNQSNSEPDVNYNNRKNLGIALFFIFIIIFVIITLRLANVSIFKRAHNVNLVRQTRQLYTQSNVIKPKRGDIYDANGQPLAEDANTYRIYAVLNRNQKGFHNRPLYVTNKSRVAQVLSKYLPLSRRRAQRILSASPKHTFQVQFSNAGENISLSTKQKIASYHLNGIHFQQQPSRLYPNGIFASHLIGLAAPVNTRSGSINIKGQMGLENSFNRQLAGRNGFKKVVQNNLTSSSHHDRPVVNGDNIYTTLDYQLQSKLEDRMSKINRSVHPDTMGAILMNARNGKILAATQRPSFNSTTKKGVNKIWRDVLTQDLYEPGSTMKAFTMAASINSHHYNGNATYQSGHYYVDGKLIPDWNSTGWGTISYNKGFALSSNVAMAHLERNMGSSTWHRYINRFKLLQPVDIGLNNDIRGNLQFKEPLEQANTAFGQGIEINAMEMMRGLSAISNNGRMLQPQLVSKVVNPNRHRVVSNFKPKVVGRPISSHTAASVRHHMEDVVYKPYGIGHPYQIHGYRIAAKTGTAQISNGKGYSSGDDNYLYSVAGMAPANNPKYVMYITMKKPKLNGQGTADQDLAQIFKPVMKQALDENHGFINGGEKRVPNLVGKRPVVAQRILKSAGFKVVVKGSSSTVKKQSIRSGQRAVKGSRIVLFASK